jgi:hypothetical protein
MERIPEDLLVNNVYPYTYKLQPKELLLDIKSWHTDTHLINYTYYTESITPLSKYNDLILLNDLERFIKKYRHKLFYRKISEILNQMLFDKTTNMKRKIRILIGLLTPIERTRFCNEFVLIDDFD